MLTEPDTPPKVVINEALELARTFSGEEPVPFINGVLDAVRKTLNGSDGSRLAKVTKSRRHNETDRLCDVSLA